MSAVLELTLNLMALNSVTPEDAGCQDVIAERLKNVGCAVQRLDFALTTEEHFACHMRPVGTVRIGVEIEKPDF